MSDPLTDSGRSQPADDPLVSLVAARAELLDSIARWREELASAHHHGPSTLFYGVGGRAATLVELILLYAVRLVAPAEAVPSRPTLGELRQVLDRQGRRVRMTCVGLPRGLVTDTDLRAIDRLIRARNSGAHHAHRMLHDPLNAGHLRPDEVREVLEAAEAVARLVLFDELECRARHDQMTPPGLP